MEKGTERQFQAGDAAVERTVKKFLVEIEQMRGQWEAAPPDVHS